MAMPPHQPAPCSERNPNDAVLEHHTCCLVVGFCISCCGCCLEGCLIGVVFVLDAVLCCVRGCFVVDGLTSLCDGLVFGFAGVALEPSCFEGFGFGDDGLDGGLSIAQAFFRFRRISFAWQNRLTG